MSHAHFIFTNFILTQSKPEKVKLFELREIWQGLENKIQS